LHAYRRNGIWTLSPINQKRIWSKKKRRDNLGERCKRRKRKVQKVTQNARSQETNNARSKVTNNARTHVTNNARIHVTNNARSKVTENSRRRTLSAAPALLTTKSL
jgi:predicted RNA-binding protein